MFKSYTINKCRSESERHFEGKKISKNRKRQRGKTATKKKKKV